MSEVAEVESRYPDLPALIEQAKFAAEHNPDMHPAFEFSRDGQTLLGVTALYPGDPERQIKLQIALGKVGRAIEADTILFISNCMALHADEERVERVERGDEPVPDVMSDPTAQPALIVTAYRPGRIEDEALMYPYSRNDDGTVTWGAPDVIDVKGEGGIDSALAHAFGQPLEPDLAPLPALAYLAAAGEISGQLGAFPFTPEIAAMVVPPRPEGSVHAHDQN